MPARCPKAELDLVMGTYGQLLWQLTYLTDDGIRCSSVYPYEDKQKLEEFVARANGVTDAS